MEKSPITALLFFAAIILCFTPATGRAIDGGTLVTPRYEHTATLLADGRVLLAGGYTGSVVTNAAELYNPATNNWTGTGSLNQARFLHGAVPLPDGRTLVMGGESEGGNVLKNAETYDPGTGQWTFTANMNSPRAFFDPVLLPNGKVLVAGGRIAVETATAELYNPATGTWAPTGSLLQPRSNYHATLLASGKVLVAGGFSQTGSIAQSEIYDPATGTWSSTGALNVPRFGNVQVRLADGRVLIAGGEVVRGGVNSKVIRSAELYDPATGLWTTTGALKTARAGFTANLLTDGRVFAAAGIDSSFIVSASLEGYDPVSGTWRLFATSLASGRSSHTTTTLLDGSLIIAGGSLTSGAPVPTAEFFVRPQ